MPPERLTKDQRREAAREAARIARAKQKRRETVNSILLRGGVTLGIVAVLAIVGLVIFNSIRPPGPGPLNMASDGVVLTGAEMRAVPTTATPADAEPTPTDTSALDVDLNIEMYVDYQCPHCLDFENTNASLLEELVRSGQASLEIHPVSILSPPFSARAANALACVAENEPASVWDANTALFALQPGAGESSPGNGDIVAAFEGAGVPTESVADCVNGGTFTDWVRTATDRATSNPLLINPASGGFGTPTVLINGARYDGSLEDPAQFAAFVAAQLPAGDDEAETETDGETEE